MRYKKLIVLMLSVLLSLLASIAAAADKPDKSEIHLSYHLLVEKKVSINADTISCRLRAENNTKELQFLSRPKEEDISLAIKGLDKRLYSVSFEERGFENLAKRGIYLRPKCAIEMELAKIEIVKPEEGKSVIPQGRYSVTALWKQPGLPDVEAGLFEVVDEYIPAATADTRLNNYEYPLGVELEPGSETYYKGEPVMMTIRLQNKGTLPICMENHLDRYKDYFEFEKIYAITNEKVQKSRYLRAAISPVAIKGYITLFPEECLLVSIDASDEFKLPTEYRVSVNYRERILVYPKDGKPKYPIYPSLGLIFPPDGQPYYTNRHTWPSNEVDIAILEADKK